MKKILLFLFVVFAITVSRAQSSIAFFGGIHTTSVTPDFVAYPDTSVRKLAQSKANLQFGFVANIPLVKHLFLHAGLLYTAKSTDYTQTFDTTNLYASTARLAEGKKQRKLSYNTVLKTNYIEIPVALMYQLPLKGNTKLTIQAGPQVSLLYNGSRQLNTLLVAQVHPDSAVIYTYKETVNNDLPIGNAPERYRVLHFGMNASVGMDFGRTFLSVNFTRDLTPFYTEEGRKYQAQTIGAGFGIYLGPRTASSTKRKA